MEPYEYEEKIYFQPGDVVTLKQDLPDKPKMIIVQKKTLTIKPLDGDSSSFFKGMICRWFTKNLELQEAVFNTKDLIKL